MMLAWEKPERCFLPVTEKAPNIVFLRASILLYNARIQKILSNCVPSDGSPWTLSPGRISVVIAHPKNKLLDNSSWPGNHIIARRVVSFIGWESWRVSGFSFRSFPLSATTGSEDWLPCHLQTQLRRPLFSCSTWADDRFPLGSAGAQLQGSAASYCVVQLLVLNWHLCSRSRHRMPWARYAKSAS